MAVDRIYDLALGQLFARALVAIARADEQIGLEEGLRLQQRIEARTGGPLALDDLLLDEPLEPRALARLLRDAGDPFRSAGMHPRDLAAMLIADGVIVALAKGYVADAEVDEIIRFASALGCPDDEIRAMLARVAPWLGTSG
ncbi:MAG TPA: hypothetical protein VFP84_37615 [Kofleriaceae bacterium]|nr:hypothetical protein [Kofleriaceae bacterium]